MIRALLLAGLLLAGPAAAQGLPPGLTTKDKTQIHDVIVRQLDAFRHDDAPAAYRLAAPSIQHLFPSADIFLDMVRRGYPPVYRPRSTEFTGLSQQDGEIIQEVELLGSDGRTALAQYSMVRDGKGGWLINGCTLLPANRVGT